MTAISSRTANAAHYLRGTQAFASQQMRLCLDCQGAGYRTHRHDASTAQIPCRSCNGWGYRRGR